MAAVQFKVPKETPPSIFAIDEFLGVDFTNSTANIDIRRTPNGQNFIRDVPGKVRKSLGWHTVATYGETDDQDVFTGYHINGYHALRGETDYIIHAGTKLYHGDTVIYSNMKDARSMSWEFDKKLYIIDGKQMLVYYKTTDQNDEVVYNVEPVTNDAYIPTVTISKDPSGGGTSYEDLNLLQPGFTEQFLGQAGVTQYTLSFEDLDDTEVTAQVLNAQGEWIDKVENTDFTVNRETGVITFSTAPGASPVTGEDNVKITAYRTVDGPH